MTIKEAFEQKLGNEISEISTYELFRAYEKSMNNGNDVLNIDDNIRCDIKEFIEEMNKNEITEFTFTSGYSSAVEVIAEFINAGFELKSTTKVCVGEAWGEKEFKNGLYFVK